MATGHREAEWRPVIAFFVVPQGASTPQVGYAHRIEVNDTQVIASVTVKGEGAISATQAAELQAKRAVQEAIDARVRDLMAKSRFCAEEGDQRAARAAAAKARFVGRTSAHGIVAQATDVSFWRRVFGVR
jgi:hypothetical protein